MQIERYIERYGNLLKLGRRRLLLFRIESLGGGRAVLHLIEGGRQLRAGLHARKPFEVWALEGARPGRRGPLFRVSDEGLTLIAAA